MFFKKKKKPINIGNYKLNLQRDNEDSRDFKLRSHITSYEPLPKSVDLRPFMPTVFSRKIWQLHGERRLCGRVLPDKQS